MTSVLPRKLWFALFVAVIFVSGIGTGLVLGRYFPFGFRGPGPPGPRRAPPPAAIAERMSRDLGLTAGQQKEIEAAFERGAVRLERFHAVTGEQFEALRQELDAEIERMLTPEQRVRFREHRPGRGRGPGPPPGPPPPR